ncbi:MAG: uroporphyrinogen decarboxylase family protein [Eubacteriales bacterium]
MFEAGISAEEAIVYGLSNGMERVSKLYQEDIYYVPGLVVCGDTMYEGLDGVLFFETLGLPLIKTDYDFPSSMEHPIKDKSILSGLKVPDPYKDGRMPINLESYSLISRHFDKPLAISLQGPFTLASELMGVMDLVRAIIRNPQYVTDLLNYTTEVVLTYALAAVQAGVPMIQIF